MVIALDYDGTWTVDPKFWRVEVVMLKRRKAPALTGLAESILKSLTRCMRLAAKLSPAPRLELFARKRREGWVSWGLDVGDPLGIGFDPENWK